MSDRKRPLVSVIMPAYNAENYIRDAITSVIDQTIADWELIIVDDCSTDRSYEIAATMALADERIRVLKNEVNSGVAKTRNRGIRYAEGQYIAFLDSDDVWISEKLERQLDMIGISDAAICYCSYQIIGPLGEPVKADYLVPPKVTFADILKENCIQCSAMMIPADIVRQHLFNTDFYHEDYILGLDILKNGAFACGCQEVLLKWRYLNNSRSFNKKNSARNRWRVYRKYLHFGIGRSIYLFICYSLAGLRKYLSTYS